MPANSRWDLTGLLYALYAYKIRTPGNCPEENTQHTEHGESLKSRILNGLLCMLQRRSYSARLSYSSVYHNSTDTFGPKRSPQDNKIKCTSHHNYNQTHGGSSNSAGITILPGKTAGHSPFAILCTVTNIGVLFETLTAPPNKFWAFMQPEGSQPCPQEPVTCLHPQPDQSIQSPPIPFLESPVLHLPIPAYVFQVVSFL